MRLRWKWHFPTAAQLFFELFCPPPHQLLPGPTDELQGILVVITLVLSAQVLQGMQALFLVLQAIDTSKGSDTVLCLSGPGEVRRWIPRGRRGRCSAFESSGGTYASMSSTRVVGKSATDNALAVRLRWSLPPHSIFATPLSNLLVGEQGHPTLRNSPVPARNSFFIPLTNSLPTSVGIRGTLKRLQPRAKYISNLSSSLNPVPCNKAASSARRSWLLNAAAMSLRTVLVSSVRRGCAGNVGIGVRLRSSSSSAPALFSAKLPPRCLSRLGFPLAGFVLVVSPAVAVGKASGARVGLLNAAGATRSRAMSELTFGGEYALAAVPVKKAIAC
eukprot:1080223-Amphidinium_carterae.1